jgi:predicted RNase H-like HicB family nuclease
VGAIDDCPGHNLAEGVTPSACVPALKGETAMTVEVGHGQFGLANWRVFCTMVTGGVEMTQHILTAILHKEDDLYVAECPEVGTVSQGYTVEEAVARLKEATELYLEEFPLPEITRPLLTTFEVATYA